MEDTYHNLLVVDSCNFLFLSKNVWDDVDRALIYLKEFKDAAFRSRYKLLGIFNGCNKSAETI